MSSTLAVLVLEYIFLMPRVPNHTATLKIIILRFQRNHPTSCVELSSNKNVQRGGKKDACLPFPLPQPGVPEFWKTSPGRETTLALYIAGTCLRPGTQSSLTWLRNRSPLLPAPGVAPTLPLIHPQKLAAFRSWEVGPSEATARTLPAIPPLWKRTFAEPSWTPWAAVAPPLAPRGSLASEHSPTVLECATWTGRQQRRVPALRPKTTMGTAEPPEEE